MNNPIALHLVLAAGGGGDNPMSVDNGMLIVTWVCFAILCVVLSKFAWKPILKGLDDREEEITAALDNAATIEQELASIGDKRKEIVAEADAKAREIVDTARKAAVDGAHTIENKARDEAKIMMENASREISAARDKAQSSLRQESADLAIKLASEIIGDNLDDAKSRALTDKLISEI
jgi:F-type H+-transporting ATPase subunit b